MIEPTIQAAGASLFGGRFYADTAQQDTQRPFATYQQVGGEAPNSFCDGVATRRNGRFQFNVWADTRAQASTLMRSLEAVLTGSTIKARAIGALIGRYDAPTKTYGAQQDFSIWWS